VDGTTAETIKLAIYAPDSPFGKSLSELTKKIWTTLRNVSLSNGVAPRSCQYLKKGDVTVMDNYRGISINIGALIKLLLTVVTQRLQDVCQTNKMIRRWQGGFMPGEECPLQVASIFDIAGRRHVLGLPTYAGFVDVREAYDTVPHEHMFSKLEANGVTGHMPSFLKALYRDSIVQVRTGEAPHISSDPFPIEGGRRQGCPPSPILFSIFINGVVDGIQGLGCEVPGCVDMLDSRQPIRVPGQLFADDKGGPCAVAR
jgi:hypothetical protein